MLGTLSMTFGSQSGVHRSLGGRLACDRTLVVRLPDGYTPAEWECSHLTDTSLFALHFSGPYEDRGFVHLFSAVSPYLGYSGTWLVLGKLLLESMKEFLEHLLCTYHYALYWIKCTVNMRCPASGGSVNVSPLFAH